MNEETLNNTTTVRGDRHIGGFILLERVDRRHWRALDWSAFFAYMIMSFGNCKSFIDNDGRAVTEFSVYNVMMLSSRLEAAEEHTSDRMVFAVPVSLAISEQIYTRWKENLPAQPNPEHHEL